MPIALKPRKASSWTLAAAYTRLRSDSTSPRAAARDFASRSATFQARAAMPSRLAGADGALSEIDIRNAVTREPPEMDLRGRLPSIPSVPEDQPLAVGGDGGDEFGATRETARRAVGAGVLRHKGIIQADA